MCKNELEQLKMSQGSRSDFDSKISYRSGTQSPQDHDRDIGIGFPHKVTSAANSANHIRSIAGSVRITAATTNSCNGHCRHVRMLGRQTVAILSFTIVDVPKQYSATKHIYHASFYETPLQPEISARPVSLRWLWRLRRWPDENMGTECLALGPSLPPSHAARRPCPNSAMRIASSAWYVGAQVHS